MRKLISETGAFFALLSVFSFAVAANVALAQNSQLDTEFLQADLFSLNQVPAVFQKNCVLVTNIPAESDHVISIAQTTDGDLRSICLDCSWAKTLTRRSFQGVKLPV